ncbi:right-handed parallel beta-helix repeat-containing protein [Ruegeria arenilitoris]|uniref:right-handed parallel beta-helix repeat-containing protein n=1 Tax=Ruegeria arenilitoris TaxID=1173585 RepID=UPI003C7CE33A
MTAQTTTVTNAAELKQALASATGGETILLAPGDYGGLNLRDAKYGSNVTIKSADPNDMASFSQMSVTNSSNVTFDTVLFDYTYKSGDYNFQSPFGVYGSSNVTFKDSIFDGDVARGTGTSIDGTGYGTGLNILNSNNVNVVGSEFKEWWKGLIAAKSDTVSVTQSDIHTIRSDGLVFDGVDNILVEQNYIHDFGGAAGSGDHRDMIQIQRAYGSGSDNITIRDNVFDMGNGDYAQTIWMGGDGKSFSDPNVIHHNVLIEGNMIYNGHVNGIAIHAVDGLVISKNTILHVDEKTLTGGVEIPAINVLSGKNVTIEQNITSQIIGYNGQSGWTINDNVLLQPGEYDQAFDYFATAQSDGYNQYGVKAGSLADTLNAGSDLADQFPFSYNSWVGTATPSSGGTNPPTDTGTTPPVDTGTTPPVDTGTTPPVDTGTTPPVDTGTTPPVDTGTDTPTDTDTDTPTDTDTDTPTDTDTDTPTDTDTDTPTDTDTDTPTDTGTDTPTDTDTDTPTDTDTDTPTDTDTDTPTDTDTDTPTDTDTDTPTDTDTDTPTDTDTDTPTDTDTDTPTDTDTDTPTDTDTDTPTDTDTDTPTDTDTDVPTYTGKNPPTYTDADDGNLAACFGSATPHSWSFRDWFSERSNRKDKSQDTEQFDFAASDTDDYSASSDTEFDFGFNSNRKKYWSLDNNWRSARDEENTRHANDNDAEDLGLQTYYHEDLFG